MGNVVAGGQEVRLIIDATKVGGGHRLLMVALAFRRRSLPIAWTWVKGTHGHSLASTQCALFAHIRNFLPASAVLVVGEEMFADFKQHGFDLESTHLRHFRRLSRLTLCVALLYLWIVAFGSATIKRGLRFLVDRTDRRDLSIFRIGLDMIERCITNGKAFFISLLPNVEKLYGS